MHDETASLYHLKKHCIIGVGTFGNVWLVEDTRNGKAYALKIQNKRKCLKVAHLIIREREIMKMIRNQFVMNLVNDFQDDKNVYFVSELIHAGELFSMVHPKAKDIKKHGLHEIKAKFYAAGIFEGLHYLHEKKILHRDLKLDNIMLGSDGYPIIIDFGAAKISSEKTFTMLGTVYYMAPEVVTFQGHDKEADIWSFAILVCEMITGTTPFHMEKFDKMKVFRKIHLCQYTFPINKKISSSVKDFMTNILKRNPSDRLKCKDIYGHMWFGNMNWNALRMKLYKAPFVPETKNALDVQYFQEWDNVEEEEIEPLSIEEQKKFMDY